MKSKYAVEPQPKRPKLSFEEFKTKLFNRAEHLRRSRRAHDTDKEIAIPKQVAREIEEENENEE